MGPNETAPAVMKNSPGPRSTAQYVPALTVVPPTAGGVPAIAGSLGPNSARSRRWIAVDAELGRLLMDLRA